MDKSIKEIQQVKGQCYFIIIIDKYDNFYCSVKLQQSLLYFFLFSEARPVSVASDSEDDALRRSNSTGNKTITVRSN